MYSNDGCTYFFIILVTNLFIHSFIYFLAKIKRTIFTVNSQCNGQGREADVLHALMLKVQLKSGGSVAEWLARWTQAQKSLGSNRSRDAVG